MFPKVVKPLEAKQFQGKNLQEYQIFWKITYRTVLYVHCGKYNKIYDVNLIWCENFDNCLVNLSLIVLIV